MNNFFGSMRDIIKIYTYGLHKKLFIMIFVIGLLLMVSLSATILTITGKSMKEEINKKLQNQTQQISNVLDSYIDDMNKKLLGLATDPKVVELMSGKYDNVQLFILHQELNILLNNLGATNLWNEFYVFCDPVKTILSSNPSNNTANYSELNLEGIDWYNDINSKTGANFMPQLVDHFEPPITKKGDMFAIAKKIQSNYTYKSEGFVLISIDKSYFTSILQNTTYTSIDLLLITNKNGEMIYDSNKELMKENGITRDMLIKIIMGSEKAFKSETGRKFIVAMNTSEKTGWNIISFSEENAVDKNLNNVKIIIIVLTSGSLVLLLIFSYLISLQFTKPVKRLIKLMGKAETEGYRIKSDINRNDEIGDLSRDFNAMMRKVLENQVLRREAEIDMLQQQINPHFLYNTLESIMSLAVIHGTYDIYTMIERLSNMFRYSISHEENKIVSLKNELQHVENYIAILKVRYEDRFNIFYDIDEEILEYKCLKFILQPIIENAIYHGFAMTTENGLITIRGRLEEGVISLSINDNGIGMEHSVLEQLEDYINDTNKEFAFKRTNSVGLRNIQERIQLFFGDQYGMKIYSEKGKGTKVLLMIPAWKKA